MIIKPPVYMPGLHPSTKHIFLAGSIEMGKAIEWQSELCEKISHRQKNVAICNPRRDDWNSSWKQEIGNPEFYDQVTWEINHIEKADLVVFYFDPNTMSPITLLELGLCAGLKKNAVVYCPEPFWRKGNVDIVCELYGFAVVNSMEDLANYINAIFWRKM
jgi:nucleoside 2-deoxyribosyltransferase